MIQIVVKKQLTKLTTKTRKTKRSIKKMECPKCGNHAHAANARYCNACGTRLPENKSNASFPAFIVVAGLLIVIFMAMHFAGVLP